ncbi:hypothetical protein N7532_004577 [Penicillium argentinense]|uniref:CID domain-containing protein n=1 Tax=Penicillium argentinense TaxID=1131581 RepID=A0A9W9FPK3_9EURO|nr:uncharacterized protein N7532_004577 [Penicillium argentinense]KAJ5104048.1 hypothetical protein N7532_004577 [Penicillium argentinense]
MPDDSKGKGHPDVNSKLAALNKKSLFERQKEEAEAKRARDELETAAVYEEFVKSFDDDQISAGPRAAGGQSNTFGGRGGAFGGGQPRRHFTNAGPRPSGPGSLGPLPPSLSKKRTHDEFASRNRDGAQVGSGYDHTGPGSLGPLPVFRSASDDEDDRKADAKEAEKAAARPTLYLASLPPGTSPSVLKSLVSSLVVEDINIFRPPNQAPTDRNSASAIITLASDSAASDIDAVVSALQNKYLGRGYFLTIFRHLSSAAINLNAPSNIGLSNSSSLPFGAKTIQPSLGGSLSRAPPPHHGGFAPPASYGPNNGRNTPSTIVEVQVPSDLKQLRLIHTMIEYLLDHGPEFEALLMARPEIQRDEKWAWLWDARSPAGVYYRWKLWQVVTNPQYNSRTARAKGPSIIFEGGPGWMAPRSDIKFEYTTRLDEFVSDEDYNSSDDEDSDAEDEKRNLGGAPPPDGGSGLNEGLGYMNPLEKAKLTHLLARLPTTHAKLRRGDISRITTFAIDHAGSGADEVVEMVILNILSPLAYTGANPEREMEREAINRENAEKDNDNPSKGKMDLSPAKLVALYVISDILSSSATSGVRHAWRYRQLFESALRSYKVFEHLGRLEKDLHWGRLRAEKWKRSIGTLLHLWEGWCVFTQPSQEHFVQVFEQPPLTEEEQQKQKEKAEAEAAQACNAFTKSKNRWKPVDDEPGQAYPHQPPDTGTQAHQAFPPADGLEGDDPVDFNIDGIPLTDSDLEMMLPDDGVPIDEATILRLRNPTLNVPMEQPSERPEQPEQPEPAAGQQEQGQKQLEPASRRPRKPRPKAEDMFASDSE